MGIIKDFMDFRKKGISIKDPTLASIFSTDSKTELTNPYSQLSVVYAAIRAKAMNVSQVPFKIYPLGGEDVIEKGAIVDLFRNVNPYSNKFQLWESIVTLLDSTGEGAVLIDSEVIGGVPIALWPWNRKNMDPAYSGNSYTGWNVKINGTVRFVPKEQVILTKYFNPYDQIRGLSPINALRLSLNAEWGAVRYNQTFFDKGQSVGSVFSTPDHLNDEAFKRLSHELIKSKQGSNHMHEALLLDGGVTLSNTRPSNKDLEFLALRKFTREEVAMVFKVPKSELSLYEDVNYATAQSADVGFWKKTLIPLMRLIQEQFNTSFLNSMGFRGEFDVQAIDALNSEILSKAESAVKFFGIGFSRNQINERLNLGFITEDEDVYKPMSLPGMMNNTSDDIKGILKALEITGQMPKEISQADIIKGLRDAKWKSLMDSILPLMALASKNVKNYFFDVEQKLLKKANKNLTGIITKADGDQLEFKWVEESFNDDRLRKAIEPIIKQSIAVGVGTYTIPDEAILQMIATRGSKIVNINETARENVLSGLRNILDDAIREGWTEQQRADAINEVIKDQMKKNKNNARTIARTETHGAYEEGRFEGIKSTNPTGKMWLSSRDGTVRPEHQIDGETVPFDKTFSNGLEYPLDPTGDAGNVINCRCTWIAVYED